MIRTTWGNCVLQGNAGCIAVDKGRDESLACLIGKAEKMEPRYGKSIGG
jgi:hypothetical protein